MKTNILKYRWETAMRQVQPLRWNGSMVPLTLPKAMLHAVIAAGLAMLARDAFEGFREYSAWPIALGAAALGPLYFHIVGRSKLAMLAMAFIIAIVASRAHSLPTGVLAILVLIVGRHLLDHSYVASRYALLGIEIPPSVLETALDLFESEPGDFNPASGLPMMDRHHDIEGNLYGTYHSSDDDLFGR